MKNRRWSLCLNAGLVSAGLLQSACFVAPPKYTAKDPFESFGTNAQAPRPFENLKLGVIFNENTLLSTQSLADSQALARAKCESCNHAYITEIDPKHISDGFSQALTARFKEVHMVQSPQEARQQACDLIVAIDLKLHIAKSAPGTTTVDIAGAFADIDANPLDQINGSGIRKLGWLSTGSVGFGEALGQALAGFTHDLDQSSKLQAFAKTKAPTAVAATAPPAPSDAAIAPPRIHSDVDNPRYHVAENPDGFAVIVGVEKYSNDLPDAQFAERDAQAMKDHLLALGYPERNIKFLTGNRATKSKLEGILEDWLPRNVSENGRVFFYFSGHGAPDPSSSQAYLVPWDGDPNLLDKTGYPVKKLYADLNALKAKQVIVALDSCFSGAGGRSVLAEGARPLVTQVDTAVEAGGKLVLFAAASAKEITSTLKDQGHGIFTYYFLKGLDEAAAKNQSNGLSAQDLYKYLKPKVQDAASRQNRDQTPVLEGLTTQEVAKFGNN